MLSLADTGVASHGAPLLVLYGSNGGSSESLDRTVDAHVKTLRAKLKAVAPGVEPIRTHRGSGYALAEDLPPDAPAAATSNPHT